MLKIIIHLVSMRTFSGASDRIPNSKAFYPKREVLIRAIEKSCLQAQLGPGVQIRLLAGFLTTLNTCWLHSQDSCGGKTVPATLNLLSDLHHAQGERKLLRHRTLPSASGKKETIFFPSSQVLS